MIYLASSKLNHAISNWATLSFASDSSCTFSRFETSPPKQENKVVWIKYGNGDPVEIPYNADMNISRLKHAIKDKLKPDLDHVSVRRISIHVPEKNRVESKLDKCSFLDPEGSGSAICPDILISNLGECGARDSNPLIVQVLVPISRNTSESIKEHHPKRVHRLERLNEVLARNRKRNADDSPVNSDIKWDDVKSILKTTLFVMPVSEIPSDTADFLIKYLINAKTCFGFLTGNEAKKLHLFTPIIVCVCSLFNDVEIEVEEDLNGKFLKTHVHFEFLLRRGDKRVLVVQAKKEKFEEGMVKVLLGCEVAAELDHLNVVYGIVTNYIQWNFYRSSNDKIEMNESSIGIYGSKADLESLINVAGKIYSMLQD